MLAAQQAPRGIANGTGRMEGGKTVWAIGIEYNSLNRKYILSNSGLQLNLAFSVKDDLQFVSL